MVEPVPLTQLVEAKLYTNEGEIAGDIEELHVDPNVGVVRFARVKLKSKQIVDIPWAAMNYAKSGAGFILTELGKELLFKRLARGGTPESG